MQQPDFQDDNNLNSFQKLPRPQKYAVVVLSFLAVLIVAFWVWQMNEKIKSPYNLNSPADNPATSPVSDVDTLLKGQDTDQDGLSDYDEIYVHRTSPYLEDTDSDGLSDQQEIAAGSNPNCPEGKNCGLPDLEIVEDAEQDVQAGQASEADPSQQELEKALSGDLDGATLRRLLLSTGSATAQDLESISDEELLSSYQEALKKQSQ